ncbi:MAG: hypothetical protein R6W69_07245 [Anaerolineales bacterium]
MLAPLVLSNSPQNISQNWRGKRPLNEGLDNCRSIGDILSGYRGEIKGLFGSFRGKFPQFGMRMRKHAHTKLRPSLRQISEPMQRLYFLWYHVDITKD